MYNEKSLIYTLVAKDGLYMKAERVDPSDGMRDHHDLLYREGRLDHRYGPSDQELPYLIGNYSFTPDGNQVDPTHNKTAK